MLRRSSKRKPCPLRGVELERGGAKPRPRGAIQPRGGHRAMKVARHRADEASRARSGRGRQPSARFGGAADPARPQRTRTANSLPYARLSGRRPRAPGHVGRLACESAIEGGRQSWFSSARRQRRCWVRGASRRRCLGLVQRRPIIAARVRLVCRRSRDAGSRRLPL